MPLQCRPMLPYAAYKLIHLVALFSLFLIFGAGLILTSMESLTAAWQKRFALFHGIAMFFVLLGGFGLMAKDKIFWPWPGWLIGKMVIWLCFGLLLVPFKRRLLPASLLATICLVLGTLAVYFVLYRPF